MGIRETRYQGGSIVSFVIVTVIIAAILVGGVMWLRHRGETAMNQQQVADSSEQQEGEESGGDTSDDTQSDDEKSNDTSAEDTAKQEGDESPDTLPGATNQSGDDADTADTQDQDNKGGSDDQESAVPAALPETGPAQTLVAATGLAVLTYAAVRYIRSR